MVLPLIILNRSLKSRPFYKCLQSNLELFCVNRNFKCFKNNFNYELILKVDMRI